MKYWTSIAIVLFCSSLFSQRSPAVFLEDLDEHSLEIKCYCKPGVRNKTRSKGIELSYQYLGQGEIRASNDEFLPPNPEYSKFRKLRAKISYPLVRGEQFNAVISVAYNAEQFELNEVSNDFERLVSSTDNLSLKSTSASFNFAYATNATNYIGGRFNISYNGGYDGFVDFGSRYAIYNGGIAFGIKKHEDNEWGFGLAGSRNFRDQGFRVLPFLFWNKTINDNWGFQITFPTSYNLRHNIDAKTILVANANYNGESYSYDQTFVNERLIAFNHSEILTVLKLEREIVPWLWLDLQAGYHFNFDSSFELQSSKETILEIDPGNSLLLKVGIFISPPDKFLK